MLLLFDIGNTSVTYGVEKNGQLTFGGCLFDDIPDFVNKLVKNGNYSHIKAIISSVVPKRTLILVKILDVLRVSVFIAGKTLSVPVKSRYASKQLGVDRQVNAYGAIQLHQTPALVIDFGTAITVDYVSKKGIFEGGLIIPGPQISFQALWERAALLPKEVRLPTKAKGLIGRNTQDCMNSGILQGYGALTDGLVARFKAAYGPLKVLSTGGFAKVLQPYSHSLGTLDSYLSIKALSHLFHRTFMG